MFRGSGRDCSSCVRPKQRQFLPCGMYKKRGRSSKCFGWRFKIAIQKFLVWVVPKSCSLSNSSSFHLRKRKGDQVGAVPTFYKSLMIRALTQKAGNLGCRPSSAWRGSNPHLIFKSTSRIHISQSHISHQKVRLLFGLSFSSPKNKH